MSRQDPPIPEDLIALLVDFGVPLPRAHEAVHERLLDRLRGCMVTDTGEIVRMERPSDYDGDGPCWPYWRGEGVNSCFMRHQPEGDDDYTPLYREVSR